MYACIEDKIINDKTIGGKIDFDIKKEKIASKMYYNCIGKICCNIKMLFPQITFTQDMMKSSPFKKTFYFGSKKAHVSCAFFIACF